MKPPPNFQVFKREQRRWPTWPAVTITKRGVIALNRAAYAAMGEPDAVELLYDRAEQIVGLRAIPRETAHACPVRPVGDEGPGLCAVAAGAFARHYGLDLSQARRLSAEMEDDVLCIDLKQAGQPVTSNRALKPMRSRPCPAEGCAGTVRGSARGNVRAPGERAAGRQTSARSAQFPLSW